MEEQNNQQQLFYKQPLPNATAVLVLGILSIAFCWCYGILGIIMGIIALVISTNPLKLYKADPEKWSGYPNLQAGRVTAIVGLSLSALFIIIVIIALATTGFNFSPEYWEQFQQF